jgi:hypothetical protein
VKLPFLEKKGLPKLRKMSGESRYGFSEDDDLIESALDELLAAIEARSHSKIVSSIKALVHCIKNKGASDAINPLQEA